MAGTNRYISFVLTGINSIFCLYENYIPVAPAAVVSVGHLCIWWRCKYSEGVQFSNFLNAEKNVERLKPHNSQIAVMV